MSSIEYTRVLDIFAKNFELENDFEYSTSDSTVERFDVTTMDNGIRKVFHVDLKEYEIGIMFSKDYIDEKKLEKLIPRMEYDLEQTFFVNINIEINQAVNDYELHIYFG